VKDGASAPRRYTSVLLSNKTPRLLPLPGFPSA